MRLALDTNVLVYAEGLNGHERRDEANDLIQRIPRTSIVVPAQAVAELFNVLVRKGGIPRSEAQRLTQRWLDSYDIVPTAAPTLQAAIGLATEHQLQIFDAMILERVA